MITLHAAMCAGGDNSRPNVLLMVVDDLRIELPVYGQQHVHAPNLARLANESLVFDNAYCNQPVCSPSRNSFMSGRRPSTTKIFNFLGSFRDIGPNWTTLPGHFLEHGFLVLGTGKIYHGGHPCNGDGNRSWSNTSIQFACRNNAAQVGQPGTYCEPACKGCAEVGTSAAPNPRWCAVDVPLNGSSQNTTLADAVTLADAISKLRFAASNRLQTGQPFFLGVGFQKPHLDWRVPAGYLDMYPQAEEIPIAAHPIAQKGRPPVSIHCPYDGASFERRWKKWGYENPWTPMRNSSAQAMRRHYWAATSFVDGLVGRLLAEVEAENLTQSTMVVFFSDHGWSLGENGDWKKFSLTELGTRVPLLWKVPWLPHTAGTRTSALVELIDVLPTMAELASLPAPSVHTGDAPLDGVSLVPLFGTSPPAQLKSLVWAQHPRCPEKRNATPAVAIAVADASSLWEKNLCINTPAAEFGWMGYSLRTVEWRYNAWFRWNGSALAPIVPLANGMGTHSAGVPANGTDGFYNELYRYSPSAEAAAETETPTFDLDALDTEELGPLYPDVVDRMHMELLRLVLRPENKQRPP